MKRRLIAQTTPLVCPAPRVVSLIAIGAFASILYTEPAQGQTVPTAPNVNTEAGTARPAQELEVGGLFAGLRDEFKVVGNPVFFMGATEPEVIGRSGKTFNVTGQPFTLARRFAVAERPPHPAHVNMGLRNTLPLKRGDYLLVTYYARGKKRPERVDDGRGALVQPLIKEAGTHNHVTNYHNITEIHEEWERYWFKRADPLTRDYAPGELELLFMVGNKAQDVEIGGLALMAFPTGSDATKLPRRTWSYVGREADAPWRKEAAARIDKIRKGDLVVNVVDAAGKPVLGAQVHVAQKKHAFKFGTAVTGPAFFGSGKATAEDSQRYREILARYFNAAVTENDLKWKLFAGERPIFAPQKTEEMLRWLKERDFWLRGHVLVWPSWHHTPDYLLPLRKEIEQDPAAKEKLRAAVRQHVTDTVTRYKGLIDDWDVTNETEGNRDYMDILGTEEIVEWYKLARAADPKVQLTFTEPSFGPGGMEGGSFPLSTRPERGWVEYLVKQGAPFDNLGSQAHGGPIAHGRNNPPQTMWKYFDELAAQHGKRLLYTELDIGIENDTDPEQLSYQADRLRDSMLIAFAHPAIDGITQWGFWQGQHWIPSAALWRKDWTIKPIGQAYIDLVYKTLWTDETVKTARDGKVQARGFQGDYEVTVTANGRTKTVPVKLPGAGAKVTISLTGNTP